MARHKSTRFSINSRLCYYIALAVTSGKFVDRLLLKSHTRACVCTPLSVILFKLLDKGKQISFAARNNINISPARVFSIANISFRFRDIAARERLSCPPSRSFLSKYTTPSCKKGSRRNKRSVFPLSVLYIPCQDEEIRCTASSFPRNSAPHRKRPPNAIAGAESSRGKRESPSRRVIPRDLLCESFSQPFRPQSLDGARRRSASSDR